MTLTVEQQRIVEENLGLVRAVLSRCVSSPVQPAFIHMMTFSRLDALPYAKL